MAFSDTGPDVPHRTLRSEALKKGVDEKNIPADKQPVDGAPAGCGHGTYNDKADSAEFAEAPLVK